MKRGAVLFAVLVTLSLGACGEDSKACGGKTGNDRAFGECCTAASECASGVCWKFGDGSQSCTLKCSTAADCPSGSQGQKCNGQGYCRT